MAALPPAALRAMRAMLDWSMRDCADNAGVALGTVLALEKGAKVSSRTEQRIRAAFRARGVRTWVERGGFNVHMRDEPPPAPQSIPEELQQLPYVVARPRACGTFNVLFEVKPRGRPDGWPATRPLPFSHPRHGDLSDAAEVAAIRADAATMLRRLEAARSKEREDRR